MAIEETARMKQRRATSYVWTNSNEVLLDGELGCERVTGNADLYKVGDGVTAWNTLPYMAVDTFSTAGSNAILRKIAIQQGISSALNSETRLPTQNENDALDGTYGSASLFNKFVTDTDPRLMNGDFVAMDVYKHANGTLNGRPLYVTGTTYMEDAPPVSPSEGDRYIIETTGGGTPHAGWPAAVAVGDIVEYRLISWTLYTPEKGWSARLGLTVYYYDGSSWGLSYLVSSDINDALAGSDGTPSSANPFVTDSDSRLVSVSEPYTYYEIDDHDTIPITYQYTTSTTATITYPIDEFTGPTSFTAANIRKFHIRWKCYLSNMNDCSMTYADVNANDVEVAHARGVNVVPGTIEDFGVGGMFVASVAPSQTNLVLKVDLTLGGGWLSTFWEYAIYGVEVRG